MAEVRVTYRIQMRMNDGRWVPIGDTYFGSLGWLCPLNRDFEEAKYAHMAIMRTNADIKTGYYEGWKSQLTEADIRVVRVITTTEVVEGY